MNNKVLIFSAPSGAGKTTVVRHLLDKYPFLEFSVSATSRLPRGEEVNGRDYFFLDKSDFIKRIEAGDFVEYEEVYSGSFYGTLKSEVERIWLSGKIVVFDIDVKGGVNLKKLYGESALAVFVQPPSTDVLRERLVARGTDSPDTIERRVAKANEELTYSKYFDRVLVNDNLDNCLKEAEKLVEKFYSEKPLSKIK
ncbi:MAG: guanylate kinase [Bacteroidales bacterium]|jgi:guanylate kinase